MNTTSLTRPHCYCWFIIFWKTYWNLIKNKIYKFRQNINYRIHTFKNRCDLFMPMIVFTIDLPLVFMHSR